MPEKNNVIVASFLRPRGFAILFGGFCFSVAFAVLFKWWLIFGGLLLSFAGYGWSVAESRSNRLFIETMSQKSLSAQVSDESRLEVLAATGSRHLTGAVREQMKLLAQNGVEITRAILKAPDEYASSLEDVPSKISSMICIYEKMAIEYSSLLKTGEDEERAALLTAAMEKTRLAVDGILSKSRIIEGGTSGLKRLSELTLAVEEDVEAVESVALELKLLE